MRFRLQEAARRNLKILKSVADMQAKAATAAAQSDSHLRRLRQAELSTRNNISGEVSTWYDRQHDRTCATLRAIGKRLAEQQRMQGKARESQREVGVLAQSIQHQVDCCLALLLATRRTARLPRYTPRAHTLDGVPCRHTSAGVGVPPDH